MWRVEQRLFSGVYLREYQRIGSQAFCEIVSKYFHGFILQVVAVQ